MSDAECDHRGKTPRTLSNDVAGCSSQQADPLGPSDDVNKKVAESNDMDTPMIDTADANKNTEGPQEAKAAAVISDVKEQDPSQLDMV